MILSWVGHALPPGARPVAAFVFNATEPVLRPLRGLIPPLQLGAVALDVSIILVFVLLSILQRTVC